MVGISMEIRSRSLLPPSCNSTFTCANAGSVLRLTIIGSISTALWDGPVPGGISIISIGSNRTGWIVPDGLGGMIIAR